MTRNVAIIVLIIITLAGLMYGGSRAVDRYRVSMAQAAQ